MLPIPGHDNSCVPPEETVEQQVRRLIATWRDQTGFLGSTTARVSHPSYRELVALGTIGLPFVFRDLEQTLDGHLSSALVAITGAQPVPPEECGQIELVARRWLEWGRQNGFLR
jgi:hypothetical protein